VIPSYTVRRALLLGVFLALVSCAIDPVPTPAERDETLGGVQTSDDVATSLKDADLAPNGAGCTCTDDQGNTYWCDLDGAEDADCTCEMVDSEPCPEDAESCEVVEPAHCEPLSETCPPADSLEQD
jgi:hypothetical protein